jgi:thiosulfate reductase cytochrome b subunit
MAEPQVRRGLPRPGEAPAPSPAAAPGATAPGNTAPGEKATIAEATPGRRSGLPRPAAGGGALVAPERVAPESVLPGPLEGASVAAPASRPRRRKLVLVVVVAVIVVAAAILLSRWFLLGSAAGQGFLARYPGSVPPPTWAPKGIPAWLGWQHFLSAFLIVLVIKSGWIVRTTRRPSATWIRKGAKAGRQKIAIELWAHLSLDLLWLLNGAVFLVLLFCTGQWARIVPTSWDIVPNAASAGLQYVSLHWPSEDGWVDYNSLQLLSYFATVFLAAPLAAVTGFRMSPLWPSRRKRLSRMYPIELARAVHFPVMLYFVVFVIVHVGLVFSTGALRNLNHMYGGQDAVNWWGFGVFVVSLAVMVAGWLLIRPLVMQQAGAVFGKVGR